MYSVLVLIAIFGYANAKFAFPIPSVYGSEKTFRTVKAGIKWDPTNLLVNLAGPLATCDRLTDWVNPGKKTAAQAEAVWTANRIDPVFFPARDAYNVYYFVLQATGADARSVANDINNGMQTMARSGFTTPQFPDFNNDLLLSGRFGCSVEPQCPASSNSQARTVVVCLFSQSIELPEFFLAGFNETWKAHSHDPYNGIAASTFPEGQEFPGYVYYEDELVVKEVVGQDLCDKHVYDPSGFVQTVQNYWKVDQPDNRRFVHTISATTKNIGWYLAAIQNVNATGSSFVTVGSDGTIPRSFNVNVLSKLFGKTPQVGAVLTKNPLNVDLNAGACVLAICPGRMVPRAANNPGKSTTKGNFVALSCMTFKTDDANVE